MDAQFGKMITRLCSCSALALLLATGAGCSNNSGGPSGNGKGGASAGSGGALETGGSNGNGGSAASGGASGSGGITGSGGSGTGGSGTGGSAAGGRSSATGGSSGGAGSPALGGRTGGGANAGGATGGVGSSGGIGGTAASGGATSPGGMTGTGGSKATGGSGAGGNPNCTAPTPPSAQDSVTLDMGTAQGAPTYRASGFIYGIAKDGSQPPNSLLTDIKITHLRCGGAQLGCPGGYVSGQALYTPRWNAVKAYYNKAKAIGATLLVLMHDLWGADAACTVPKWPGDGGDWTQYTAFVDQVVSDLKAAGMTGKDVRVELWNEPDVGAFWGAQGGRTQWLEMWKRGYQQMKAALPDTLLEGPTTASGVGGQWFTSFLDYIKTNNVVPDYIGWHGGDPANDVRTVKSALSSRGITVSNFDNSEYGAQSEQNPGHSAWYIARLERGDLDGLRCDWGMGSALYANMGALVTNSWQPTSQYWVYKRYADQTGLRTNSTAGRNVDAVGFQDADKARAIIVVGNNGSATGSVNVIIKNMPAWLQNGGSTKVILETMATGNSAVSAPTVVSSAAATVTCNALTVTINWATATDGYAITLTPS